MITFIDEFETFGELLQSSKLKEINNNSKKFSLDLEMYLIEYENKRKLKIQNIKHNNHDNNKNQITNINKQNKQ